MCVLLILEGSKKYSRRKKMMLGIFELQVSKVDWDANPTMWHGTHPIVSRPNLFSHDFGDFGDFGLGQPLGAETPK